jgi:hypothetical protein
LCSITYSHVTCDVCVDQMHLLFPGEICVISIRPIAIYNFASGFNVLIQAAF